MTQAEHRHFNELLKVERLLDEALSAGADLAEGHEKAYGAIANPEIVRWRAVVAKVRMIRRDTEAGDG